MEKQDYRLVRIDEAAFTPQVLKNQFHVFEVHDEGEDVLRCEDTGSVLGNPDSRAPARRSHRSHHSAILLILLLILPGQLPIHGSRPRPILPTTLPHLLQPLERLGKFVRWNKISQRSYSLNQGIDEVGDLPAALPYHLLASSTFFGHPIPFSLK